MSTTADNSYQTNAALPVESFTGVVERITYHSDESGYTVARVKIPRAHELVTVVGNFANIQAGQTLQLTGNWRNHPHYGEQFQTVRYAETKPATITGIEKYLGSGLIKGVGPVMAKRIVARFGTQTLDIIENQIDRLVEVNGIGKKRVSQIAKAWAEQKVIKEVMIFLQGHGVSTTYTVKIFKQYGEKAIAVVTENPYQLATDIYGIGFLTADKIAQNLGVLPSSPDRYLSGILHVLSQAAEDGHCFLPQPELVNAAVELLTSAEHQTQPEGVLAVIDRMVSEQQLMIEMAGTMPLCYQPSFYWTEQNLAQLIGQQTAWEIAVDRDRVRNWIERFTASRGIQLSEPQRQAVELAASAKVMILTGGPGTGKTFALHTIVALWKAMGKEIALAAPTGRAAQRLGEMTGIEAKTIHRLLEFDPGTMGFKRQGDNLLSQNAFVVDEASMLDLFLAHSLLKAIPPQAQLLLVGDIDQLPSVGPGNVLKDAIDSQQIPVVRLTQVFRQAQSSAIIRSAHQINQGQYPHLEPIGNDPKSDCLWHSGGETPEDGVQAISDAIANLIPRLGFDPATDVQVLCPMTRGAVGTRNLNQVLQQLINPPSPAKAEIARGGTILRVGDRVIQLKNDYDREVFNGDLGIIAAIDSEEQELMVRFDDRDVTYDYADLNEIALAWAVTTHKSQGSEYPVVILPMYMQHYLMLSRNLLYTGLTRAKKLAIIVGNKKAIALAIKQQQQTLRYTRLSERVSQINRNIDRISG
jgi:exodeoxyribonuclease V alpha subunit